MRATTFALMFALVLLTTQAIADVPGLINFQGTLTDSNGVALNTIVSMTFSIYTDSTGGAQVWTETQPLVEVNNGLFNVLLGRVNAISDTVFNGASRWLGVRVESDPELDPRQRMAAVGYAFRASVADTADFARAPAPSDGDWTISGNHMYSAVPGSVCIGTTTPSGKLTVDGGDAIIKGGDGWDGGGDEALLYLGDYNHGVEAVYGQGLRVWTFDDASSDIRFRGHTGTDYMTIKMNSGQVGIGTVSPGSMLDVSGDVNTDSLYKIDGISVLSTPGNNTHVGVDAGANDAGVYATYVGYNAGYDNSGYFCTFLGAKAGYSNEGALNTFVGAEAGMSNTSGDHNTFVGWGAGSDDTTGFENTFIGSGAGWHNTSGRSNTFLGFSSGINNTTGEYNTFLGSNAGESNETGNGNTCVGISTGVYNAAGHNNTFLGTAAGLFNEGSNNVFIGYQAGYDETGSNKLYIANNYDTSSVLIYGDFSTDRVGIGTLSPGYTLDVVGDINTTGEVRQNGNAYDFPDYVFEPGYELMPLAELSNFVAANKHLPGMPSAEEVKKDGVKLFEQNRFLVEKLEEAYLYIIELQKRMEELETVVTAKLDVGQ